MRRDASIIHQISGRVDRVEYHGQPGFIQNMAYYSENQEAKHATNALLANRAALMQTMNIVHLKSKISGSTRGTQ